MKVRGWAGGPDYEAEDEPLDLSVWAEKIKDMIDASLLEEVMATEWYVELHPQPTEAEQSLRVITQEHIIQRQRQKLAARRREVKALQGALLAQKWERLQEVTRLRAKLEANGID